MNKNVSRIAAAFGTTAMIALGTAGIAGAQDALNATTTDPVSEPTSVSVSSEGDKDPLALTQSGSRTGTPKNLSNAEKQADTGGKQLPGYAVTDVKLNIIASDGNVLKEDADLKDVRSLKSAKYTVQGEYNFRIPDPARAGDYFDIKFYNGAGGKNWRDNLRKIKDDNGVELAEVTSNDGQTYRVKILKDSCGLSFGFTLNSNIDGTKSSEVNGFDYTKAEKAPEGFQWQDETCKGGEIVTETAPTSTAPTVTGPTVTGPTVTRTAPTVTADPIIEDDDSDSGSTSGGRGGRGGAGSSGSSGNSNGSNSESETDSNDAGTPSIMTPGANGGANTGAGTGASDHQTVISGGGFTDNSKDHIPSWIRSDGGESISVEDDPNLAGDDEEAAGPEVNTGGAAENASFFAKVANLFR